MAMQCVSPERIPPTTPFMPQNKRQGPLDKQGHRQECRWVAGRGRSSAATQFPPSTAILPQSQCRFPNEETRLTVNSRCSNVSAKYFEDTVDESILLAFDGMEISGGRLSRSSTQSVKRVLGSVHLWAKPSMQSVQVIEHRRTL